MSTDTLPGVADLLNGLATFRYSLFRLEALQVYSGSSADEAYAAFQVGQPIPVTAELAKWCDMVSRRVRAGCAIQRVHVITLPLSDYLRFELASYAPNVRAGEDVRVIPVDQGEAWPVDVPREDFWLIDSIELWKMRYDQDGGWLGSDRVDDPASIMTACHARDASLQQAVPWSTFMGDQTACHR